MVTQTPRLKLTVDADGSSNISTLSANWDRVDQAAGALSTVKGVDLPNSMLFDGARVIEKDTGISWIAKSDGGGGYTKQYINYPFTYVATYNGGLNPMNGPWGFDTFSGESINSSFAANNEAGTNRFKVTVKGLYTIMIRAAYGPNPTGQRELVACINGNTEYQAGCERLEANPTSYGTNLTIQFERILNIGDTVTGWVAHNAGTQISLYHAIFATLVRPMA